MAFCAYFGRSNTFSCNIFSGQIFQTGSLQTEAEITSSLDILLNPFASISQAEVSLSKPINLPEISSTNFSCSKDSETISLKIEKSKIAFSKPVTNKYIFADNFTGKSLWVFSKPFEMPWRVDDLIYVVSKDYCFINPPEKIKKELNDLNSSRITVSATADCSGMKVCFSGICDIFVSSNYVRTKRGEILNYGDDATMYAAIFGPEEYECNIKRLMSRLQIQSDIFSAKASKLCTGMTSDLISLKSTALAIQNNPKDNTAWANIKFIAAKIDSQKLSCPIYQ